MFIGTEYAMMRRCHRSRGTGRRLVVLAVMSGFFGALAYSQTSYKEKAVSLEKTQSTTDHDRAFTINDIFNYYSNNGTGSYNRYTSNPAFEFPKGSGKTAVFEDGVLWGGFHKGREIPKVGGSMYRSALQAGRIVANGTATSDPVADDPLKPQYRLYCVRPDVTPRTSFESVRGVLTEEASLIARFDSISTAQSLYDQYISDWNEWPARSATDPKGLAPFADVNGDGLYDPAVDIPGQPGADQTLYYVANDVNASRTNSFYGSPPIGLEMHKTIWGYARLAALNQTIFSSTLLINKSGAPVDSMFLVQWSDCDLGDAGDDFVGCDTTRDLDYTYNSRETDAMYGRTIPAVGYQLLQGPRVPGTGDSALFRQSYRQGHKNLGMTTFVFFSQGFAQYADPASGVTGDGQWYRMMNGFTASQGLPFIDPVTGQPTKFCLSGDPVTGVGWIDGMAGLTPQDRRMCLVTGPFTMADNDTQEVVVATLIAQGADRISSITELKAMADLVRPFARSGFVLFPPLANVSISYPDPSVLELLITADTRGTAAQSVSGLLRNADGILLGNIQLNDLGKEGDVSPGDGIFTVKVTSTPTLKPLTLDLTVVGPLGTAAWPGIVPSTTVAGPLPVAGPEVFSDNINSDGIANPGENIRYGITITNATPFPMRLNVTQDNDPHTSVAWTLLSPSTSSRLNYNPANPQGYLSVDIPANFDQPYYRAGIWITDENGNRWRDSVLFHVHPLLDSLKCKSSIHASGIATGSFEINAVDQLSLKHHLYVIRGVDSIDAQGNPGLTLKDSTDGRILFERHPIPDSLGHNMPVTDGFKVLRGDIALKRGYKEWNAKPWDSRRWSWQNADGLGLEGLEGSIGNGYDNWFSGSTVGYNKLTAIEIRYANADGTWDPRSDQSAQVNFSRGYRYLDHATLPAANPSFVPWIINPTAGFAYQDYNWGVPWAAYDINVDPPRRLMVGFLENNTAPGLVDGRHWPHAITTYPSGVNNTDSTGPREWFFIFDIPYSTIPDSRLEADILHNTVPMMWFGTVSRRNANINYAITDTFRILTLQPPTSADMWLFRPDSLQILTLPEAFSLEQNFPNPFNPSTQINYDLPYSSQVSLRIYDILGQEVVTLVNEFQRAGRKTARWEGMASGGYRVASGVYFYRIRAQSGLGDFIITKKMIVLR